MPVASRAILMAHDKDPKQDLLDRLAPYLDDLHPLLIEVLLATYERPEKTASGVYMPETMGTRREDTFQGKSHLIVKLGPLAFQKGERDLWPEGPPKLHDWVIIGPNDYNLMLKVGDVSCRLMPDSAIRMRVGRPDIIL